MGGRNPADFVLGSCRRGESEGGRGRVVKSYLILFLYVIMLNR